MKRMMLEIFFARFLFVGNYLNYWTSKN